VKPRKEDYYRIIK